MKKFLKRILICGMIASVCWGGILLADRHKLNTGLIRLHVVANSDSDEDQAIKITVRDAVLNMMRNDLGKIADVEEARAYLQSNIPKLLRVVNETLEDLGCVGDASVSLCRESFDIRHYDTFYLPAGVYESLQIVIGEGLGKNWWCVTFPTLCIPATTSDFEDAAVGAGFSDPLVQTLAGNENYEIHFFFLDQLGRLENILFRK